MVLKPTERTFCVHCGLRAVRFTLGLQAPPLAYCFVNYRTLYKTPLISSPSLSVNCSGTPMLDVCDGSQCLQTAWLQQASCLKAVWFTRVLKQVWAMVQAHICLRAVRFTMVLKHVAPQDQYTLCLRAVRFTRVLKRFMLWMNGKTRLRAVRFTRVLKPKGRKATEPCCLRAVRFTIGLKQRQP